MSVKNAYKKYFTLLSTLITLLLLSTIVAPVSAYTPPYPPLSPGDYHIAYDDGVAGGIGYMVTSDGDSIRVLYTPSVNGLVHEVRIVWAHIDPDIGFVRLVIEDADTPTTETSDPIQITSSQLGSWQVIDVLSLGFVTSGDFYVYIQYDSGGKLSASGSRRYMAVIRDLDVDLDNPGRFQISTRTRPSWSDRPDMLIRAVITPLPGQVIPEVPYGTIMTMTLLLLGFAIYVKRPF